MFSTDKTFMFLMNLVSIGVDCLLVYGTYWLVEISYTVIFYGSTTRRRRAVVAAPSIILFFLLFALNQVVLMWIHHTVPSRERVVLGVVLATVFASLLFFLKTTSLFVFAVAEGAFAFGSCIFSMSLMGDKLAVAEVIAFISSVYLMIQAMDDVKRGYKEKLEKEARNDAARKERDSRKAVLAEER